MSPKVKRSLNAFIIGALGAFALQFVNAQLDLTSAIDNGEWSTVRSLVVSLAFGAVTGGIRAVQSNVPIVPSPEPEENPPAPPAVPPTP